MLPKQYKSIGNYTFLVDLQVSSLAFDPSDAVDHLVDLYEMPGKPMLLCYKKNIQSAKRHKRYCELLWIRISLCVHYEMTKVSKSLVKYTYAKSEYYNTKIKARKGNQKLTLCLHFLWNTAWLFWWEPLEMLLMNHYLWVFCQDPLKLP